jgi:hypothetical protein
VCRLCSAHSALVFVDNFSYRFSNLSSVDNLEGGVLFRPVARSEVQDTLVAVVLVILFKARGFKPGRGRWVFKGDVNL